MTKEQAETLSSFALKAMPKSSDEQRIVLLAAIEKYPAEVVHEAIIEHASESEFISTPKILDRVREKVGGTNAQRMEREALERLQKAQREATQKREQITNAEDPTVVRARDFCRDTEPALLATWRAEIEAENPVLARRWAGKETWDAITLACLIHGRFGKVPRECWIGGAA